MIDDATPGPAPDDRAAKALRVVRSIDWAKLRRSIDERIICLSAVCSDELDEPEELKAMMARDLVIPCLDLLRQFWDAVQVEDDDAEGEEETDHG